MYLTKIPLDTKNRKLMIALNSPNLLHGALESSFSGERKRNLWRIDSMSGKDYILLLSEDIPDLNGFCSQFGTQLSDCETKNYDALLQKLEKDSVWHFRITANPTKSLSNGNQNERGKIVAHTSVKYQKQWLCDKAVKNGFEISENSFEAVSSKWYRFKKNNKNNVSLLSVTYEGLLKVTDTEMFKNALINGIGREKAYGMGMLTVVRHRGN